jgi:hypothetical protein
MEQVAVKSHHMLTGNWKPISKAEFEKRLKTEIGALPADLLSIYTERATAIEDQPCFRSEQRGPERVFLVARSGKRILTFDDVEDEFAIGMPDDDGVLRHWDLYGGLSDALRAF